MPGFFKVYRPYKGFINPLTLSPALWLDASDITTLFQDRTGASASTPVASDSDPVGTWLDKSGNAFHVTAGSDAARVAYKTNILGSKPGLLSDGVDDLLATTSTVLTKASARTIISVGKTTASKEAIQCYFGGSGSVGYSSQFGYFTTPHSYYYFDSTNSSSLAYVANTDQSSITSAGCVATVVSSGPGNKTSARLNGTAQTLTQTGTIATCTNDAGLSLFGRNRASPFYVSMYLMELLVFGSVLTTPQIQQVEQYLASKWGITLS